MSLEFLIPWALDDNDILVVPATAEKGETYRCPGCRMPLLLRKGTINRAHFAHRADTNCTGESVLHKAAKYAVKNAIEGDRMVRLERKCGGCSNTKLVKIPTMGCKLEHRTDQGLVVDLAMMNGEKMVGAVEILVTHAVDEDKAARLDVSWVELVGKEAVKNPHMWKPTQDYGKSWICKQCVDERIAYECWLVHEHEKGIVENERLHRYAGEIQEYFESQADTWWGENASHPPIFTIAPLRAGLFRCPCGEKTVVYEWPDGYRPLICDVFPPTIMEIDQLPTDRNRPDVLAQEYHRAYINTCNTCGRPLSRMELFGTNFLLFRMGTWSA